MKKKMYYPHITVFRAEDFNPPVRIKFRKPLLKMIRRGESEQLALTVAASRELRAALEAAETAQ